MEGKPVSPGGLLVRDGVILAVGDPASLKKQFPAAQQEDFGDKTILPGLVNSHADLSLSQFPPQSAFEQTPDGRVALMPWLIRLSRYKGTLSINAQRDSVLAGLEQMRRLGVTTVADKCRYPAALPLYRNSGLRIVCLAEVENIQRVTAQEDFEQALAIVDEVQSARDPNVSAGLAPFSAYTLSKNLLKILANHAVQQQVPMHLHGAMSFSEMEFFYDSLGEITAVLFKEAGWEDRIPPPHRMTPIQYLHEIGVLKAKPSIVGCVHLGPTDAAIMEHQGCRRIYAPTAFQHLQLGDIPWDKIFRDKIPWSLATLGAAWGSSGDLWQEMRAVFYETDESSRSKNAETILRAATLGGAQALSLESRTGSLVKDKQADFIVVETPEGDDSLAAGLLDQTRSEHIAACFVAGRRVYRR